MISEVKIKIAKELLESGSITVFRDLFQYVPRSGVAQALGVNYGRFLGLIKSPGGLRYSESAAIAKILRVSHHIVAQIILNQLDQKRTFKPKLTKK